MDNIGLRKCKNCCGTTLVNIGDNNGQFIWGGEMCEECEGGRIKWKDTDKIYLCRFCMGGGKTESLKLCEPCNGQGILDWVQNMMGRA